MILDLYLTHNEFKYPRVNKDLLIIFFSKLEKTTKYYL